MLGAARKSAAQLAALDRIEAWTRARFSLPAEAAILVSETACAVPGCPPLETVVAFWTLDATRHHFKLFKPALAVVENDLPYAWLMKSLAVPEGFADDCC
jgi:nitrate reductase delta subunit